MVNDVLKYLRRRVLLHFGAGNIYGHMRQRKLELRLSDGAHCNKTTIWDDAGYLCSHLVDYCYEPVETASISSLEKIFETFPAAYWDFKPTYCNASNEQPHNNGLESDSLPGFVNFLNPTYAPLKSNKSFALEVNTLSNPDIFGKHAQPTLIFSLFGDLGHELTTIINELSPNKEEYFTAGHDFTRSYYNRLPNYDPNKPECMHSAVIATNWQHDDLAGNGSYTNFKVSENGTTVVLDDEVRAMRAGMPERGIWLAGEHVALFIGLGTSTGAYWSGEMAAIKILGANGIRIPKD